MGIHICAHTYIQDLNTGISRYSVIHLVLFSYSALAYPQGRTLLCC
jgi:hypothetical protein